MPAQRSNLIGARRLLLACPCPPADLVAHYVKTYIVQAFRIPSEAMQPTLVKGDRVLVDKRIYRRTEPQRGDIVVFQSPDGSGRFYIKRLVGLPGEGLELKDGHLFVNGGAVKSPLSIVRISYRNGGPDGQEGKPVVIPDGQYDVLSDNSAQGRDSRYFGFISRENLVGRAYKLYYPFDRSGPLE